jgi:protein TonB
VTTLSPEAQAALDRVKELEEKLRAFEAERAEAEAKASEEARKKLEAQAKALGTTADPTAVAKAQEEAARRARLEQEQNQLEERRRLEEAKAAEVARVAEERRRAEEAAAAAVAAAAAAAVATTTTTLPPTTTLAPTTQAALKPGTLVNLSDAGVTPPVPEKAPSLQYPSRALRQRVEGTVELSILVDERGVVTDAQVVTSAGGRAGLDEAAMENARKRKYRPATKDGVPVKVWMPLRVQFKLPG